MILSFRTGRSGQTEELLEEQSDQGLHCLQCHLQPLDAVLYNKPPCSNFRVITANFSGVRIFRIFGNYCNDLKYMDRQAWENSVDPDQTAPES